MAFPNDHLRLGFIGSRRRSQVVTSRELLPLCAPTSRARCGSLNPVPSGLSPELGSLQYTYAMAVRGSAG